MKKLFLTFSQDIAELIEELYTVANYSLEKIQFQIKKGMFLPVLIVLCFNRNLFLIHTSLQPDVVNLRYFNYYFHSYSTSLPIKENIKMATMN